MKERELRLYMEDYSQSVLQNALSKFSDLEAWYRESWRQVTKDEKKYFEEINWFLTRDALIQMTITPEDISTETFLRKEIIGFKKNYIIHQGFRTIRKLITAKIKFRNGSELELKRPDDPGTDEGIFFEKLIESL